MAKSHQILEQLVRLLHAKSDEIDKLQKVGAAFHAKVSELQADRHLILDGIRRIEANQTSRTNPAWRIAAILLATFRPCYKAIWKATWAVRRPYLRYRSVASAAARLRRRGLHRTASITTIQARQHGHLRDQILPHDVRRGMVSEPVPRNCHLRP